RIKAGEYQLPNGASPNRIMDIFIAGKSLEYSLVLVEGWTFRQVLDAVAAHSKLKQTLTGKSHREIMAALNQPDSHPEGRFFPDTYHFNTGMTDLEFLRRAYLKMEDELANAWSQRTEHLPLTSPEEVLILASLIEKETGQASERREIAGVFVRRLKKDMRLQTDPTVIYGLGEAYTGNLRKVDLQQDTPYNTYTRKGLPPTPIAMPGRAALQAAVNPASGSSLFFVARGDGSHKFSATLQAHECAVIEFQLKPKAPKQFARRCRAMPYCKACRE
ncbi:MAG: endolytic transglycosylase MltG, partial [Pseudomonadota bacterium]